MSYLRVGTFICIVAEGFESRNFTGAKRPPSNPDSAERTAQSDRIVMLDGDGESNGDYRSTTTAIEMIEKT